MVRGGAGFRGKDTALFEMGNSPTNTILFFRFLFGSISGGQFSAGLSDFGRRPQCCVLFDRRVAQRKPQSYAEYFSLRNSASYSAKLCG